MAVHRIAGTTGTRDVLPPVSRPVPKLAYGIDVRLVQSSSVPAKIAIKKVVDDLREGEYALRRAAVASEVTEMMAPITLNLALAHRAKAHVRSLLSRGSNAAPSAKLSPKDAMSLIGALRREGGNRLRAAARKGAIAWTADRMPDGAPALRLKRTDVDRVMAGLLKEWGYGHCAEQAAAAYCFLSGMDLHGSSVDACGVKDGDHAVVVIGRLPGSDPEQMKTWGPDAVVCDPWADKAYPLSRLEEMQRPENDVKDILAPQARHYLAGPLYCMDEEIGLRAQD